MLQLLRSNPFLLLFSLHIAARTRRLARYKKLIGPISFVLGETENDVSIEVVPGDYSCKLPRFLVESEFAFLIGMIRKATGRSVVPVRVEFTENSDDSTFAEFAGIMTQPSMKNRITFSRNDLELPFITYTDMSTADIAYLLGYSEVNSFLRAFAAWTGKNLSDYRAG